MKINSKTGTQRRSQQPTPGSGSNQSKRTQLQLDTTRRRSPCLSLYQYEILHGRIQIFFYHRLNRCISSIKSTSLGSKLVSTPAKSPGLSSTGPEVTLKPTPSSLAMILLKVVLPKPGGPCKRTWSNASARRRAALTKMRRLSTTLSCPLKSSNSTDVRHSQIAFFSCELLLAYIKIFFPFFCL